VVLNFYKEQPLMAALFAFVYRLAIQNKERYVRCQLIDDAKICLFKGIMQYIILYGFHY
jgi:hypothetical protein